MCRNTNARVFACLLLSAAVGSLDVMAPVGVMAQDAITVAEAVERALAQSPAYAQSSAAFDNASAGHRTAWGAFIPNFNVSSGASIQSSQRFDETTQRVVSGNSDSYNAGLSASMNLFSGGRRFAELDRTAAELDAASARVDDQRFAVVLETQTIFFNALRQQDLLAVQRTRVERAEESLATIRRRVELGTGTVSDSLRARLELTNARQAELQAETAVRAAEFALGRQVGLERPISATRPDDLAPAPLALTDTQIYEMAVAASPSVVAAEADLIAAQASLSSARTAYLPNLNLASGYTWANSEPAFSGGNTSWSLRLSASYPLFNGFSREANVQRAEASAIVSRMQSEDTRLRARERADAALYALRTAERAIVIAQEGVAVATEDLRVVRVRYDTGVATILDLTTSQVALQEAEVGLVAARYDYVLARAELEAILGREL
jgi:outer membrane protein